MRETGEKETDLIETEKDTNESRRGNRRGMTGITDEKTKGGCKEQR